MAELEETFGAPVIESYGMTEAAHQMTSNPMPPQERKPGSVGLPAGPEVAIMDEDGALLAMGQRGEVVIRGDNVTDGYRNNPEANATAYTRGWFDRNQGSRQRAATSRSPMARNLNGAARNSPRESRGVLLLHPSPKRHFRHASRSIR